PAHPPTSPAVAPTAVDPCRGTAPPARWSHVVWVVMENRGLDQIEGNPAAPYLNRLGAECGLATDYSAVAHPSLPNYIALTSGSTQGIADDAGPDVHPLTAPSIFGLLGPGWRALEESMPAPCDRQSGGEYAVKHNPAGYYTAVTSRCAAQDVPLTDPPDLSAPFTFITPNLCDDMHDCSTAAGDAWLAREVPAILDSAEYRSGGTALFVTWDENDAGGTLVPLYVVAPSVPPGVKVASPLDHYSLLRTTEEMLGLTPLLGQAATAPGMGGAFHL
ncbi:MAG TPA: alkaline phosphatase family protein, partial [Acidimicrobiales bacterium]|nr:alkaline phosphatase family protein [Acidimicrobiales bacterium]